MFFFDVENILFFFDVVNNLELFIKSSKENVEFYNNKVFCNILIKLFEK